MWATDLHLNFVGLTKTAEFCKRIKAENEFDIVVISGDIAEAPNVVEYLKTLEKHIAKPIYFILGNHDFYHGSIKEMFYIMKDLSDNSEYLNWLTVCSPIVLGKDTCMIGRESWNDCLYGNWNESNVVLNDYKYIDEFRRLNKNDLYNKLGSLAGLTAAKIEDKLRIVLTDYKNVFLITHVPMFKEICCWRGKMSGEDYLPHYSNKTIGVMLFQVMKYNIDNNLTVLCGHTHGQVEKQITDNIYVKVGDGVYNAPKIQEIITV